MEERLNRRSEQARHGSIRSGEATVDAHTRKTHMVSHAPFFHPFDAGLASKRSCVVRPTRLCLVALST